MMQIAFGNRFIFRLESMLFDEVQLQSSQRWSNHERLGQRPQLQNLGPGTEQMTLPGAVFDCWIGNIDSMNELYRIKEEAKPQELWAETKNRVYNRYERFGGRFGRYEPGRWVIADISETRTILTSAGPKQIDWSLSLMRYD